MDNDHLTPKKFISTVSIIHLYFGSFLVGFIAVLSWIHWEKWTYDLESLDFVFPFLVPVLAVTGVIAGNLVFKTQLKALDAENDLKARLSGYQTAVLIKYAFIQAPALLGIVAAMKSVNVVYLIIAGLLMIYFIFQRPTRDKIERDLNLTGELKKQFKKQTGRMN